MNNEELMGKRIREKRIEKDLTMEQLGNLVGVQKSAVNKWEHGIVKNMKRSVIQKVSDVLGISPAYLMGWDEDIIDAIAQDQQEQTEQFMKINAILEQLLELDLTEDEAEKIVEYGRFIRSQRK